MKLQQIEEKLHGSRYFNRPSQQTQALFNPATGHDAGSRSAGYSFLTSGVPNNPRHRQYLGFEKRLGAIRL
jgi:hypothetical protein